MKIKFEAHQKFQEDAIAAVADLFEGQPADASSFLSGLRANTAQAGQLDLGYEIGAVGNSLVLDEDAILENLQAIQNRNGLEVSTKLDGMNFSVEMETGTGKTYVYLRTIFELNKRYNFTKFVILVPSVAIKEGVRTSIELMREHFNDMYAAPFDNYVYSGKSPEETQSFATATTIQIMVMTIDSIKGDKNTRIMHQERDKLNGIRPIDFLAATNPIVIMDEPQNMESALSQKAVDEMNATCTLRYSATHKNEYNLVYRLDPVDAHQQGLVKRIVVANTQQAGSDASPYIRVINIKNDPLQVKLELLVQTANGLKKQVKTLRQGSDLYDVTGNAMYANNWRVNEINSATQEVELTNLPHNLKVGDSIGGNDDFVYREMIRETIKEHLRKEYMLRDEGIKVLSLFFVDRVASYIEYDDDGNELPGKFQKWFDEIFIEERDRSEQYKEFYPYEPRELRKAYFAEMKKGGKTTWIDSSEGRSTANDSEAYDLIMKNKEKLLDIAEPTRFIFSHSALKEGWDNPNVFQICMMRESGSALDRRQTIGRGLRLPVNQEGERVRDADIAQLTVVASESFREFADSLQNEYKRAGVSIGVVRKEEFSKLPDLNDTTKNLGYDASVEIWNHLLKKGMVDEDGKVLDNFMPSNIRFTLDLPEAYKAYESEVISIMRDCKIETYVKQARKRKARKFNSAVAWSPEFQEFWDAISKKTTYRVALDRDAVVYGSISAIKKAPRIQPLRIETTRSKVRILRGGAKGDEIGTRIADISGTYQLPDIVSELQDETKLTRATIVDILTGCGRLHDFLINPNDFMQMAKQAIKDVLGRVVIDGIQYEKINDVLYQLRQLQEDGEAEKERFIDQMYEVKNKQKTVFDYVIYDSEVENNFAARLDSREDIKLFMKLPDKFKIPTPVGPYNPDWAIVKQEDGQEKIYMIRETKSTQNASLLRDSEQTKIDCGKKHFEAIGINNFAKSSPQDWNL